MNMLSLSSNGIQVPRLDRLTTIYLCHPLTRLTRRSSAVRVPMLMYHSVSENLFGKVHPYTQINTTPSVFASQMRWLRREGYHSVDLSELLPALEAAKDLSKAVCICTDRGAMDCYQEAFPIM